LLGSLGVKWAVPAVPPRNSSEGNNRSLNEFEDSE
jgi:hypothetical protein